MLSRRKFLKASGAALLLPQLNGRAAGAVADASPIQLKAQVCFKPYAIAGGIPTEFWGFNGQAPGPELRFSKGDLARISVSNGLTKNTAIHWHGIRVPHAMDGVPNVSQPPIIPGATFEYEFLLRDSGTFWYHPHERSFEQVGRGLSGALIVEEASPPKVERDIAWVLQDFLLDPATGAHRPFKAMSEHAPSGRIGNVITINGTDIGTGIRLEVAGGERVRLRLINASTARVFSLDFDGHKPWVIAFDGHGVTPHLLASNTFLGPGMRLDLILDCVNQAEQEFSVNDSMSNLSLAKIAYPERAALRSAPLPAPARLAANDIPVPDLKKAIHHQIEFRGGDAGLLGIGIVNGKAISYDNMKRKFGLAWTVANHAAIEHQHQHEPLLVLKHNASYVFNLSNLTAFAHPIHLHGTPFQVLTYNGSAPRYPEWRDTVFLNSFDEVQIAFVAATRGDWMFHCHILEHAASGMMGLIRVE